MKGNSYKREEVIGYRRSIGVRRITMSYKFFGKLKHTFPKPSPFIRRECRTVDGSPVLIVACAGWGKTSYLAQLAEENEDSVCISVGVEDNSCGRMIELLAEALPEAGIVPGVVRGTGVATDVTDGSDKGRGDGAYDAACKAAEALSRDGGRLLLVDNASLITESGACALLEMLIKPAMTGEFRAVFAARVIPRFLLSGVMDGSVKMMGINELRFTRSETAELAAAFAGSPTDMYVNTLHSFSGGWCAAAATLARIGGDPCAASDRSYLRQYMSDNILASMTEDLREYLLMTAFIATEDAELSREVFRVTDGRARSFELATLGIASEEGEPYPEVMRRILSTFLPSKLRSDLIKRAADHFIKNKRFAEAVALFEESGDSPAAERFLRLYGAELLANCEFELIGYCGRIIGRPEAIADPEVLGTLAQYHYYSGEYERMERAYNLADSMFGKENKFGIYRMLYNGLRKFEANPKLYAANVRKAAEYLAANGLAMPFLYQKEQALFENLLSENEEPKPEQSVLSVFRFGDLKLMAGSEQREIQCKTRRSLELIAYLLENRGRAVSREELLNALWPDDMPANAVAMLHNMIYNLRRELSVYGLENVISYKNRSYTVDMSMLREADADILAVCRCVDSGDTGALLAHEAAAENYWGRFLGSFDSLWAREKKEYYDRCYINACMMLSEHYRASGEYERELIFLKNALRLDPYSEQLVHDILVCCAALGKPDKVNRYYEEYSARLDADFGTRPSKWLRSKYLSCFGEK